MPEIIYINDPRTWPDDLIQFLNENEELIAGWECSAPKTTLVYQFDNMIYALRDILRGFSLRGYHCTKLIEDEIVQIQTRGMSLQNRQSLCVRIDGLLDQNLIDSDIASRLKNENQADDTNRARMLWFCFFDPFIAGEGGIERFFRSWGGEALYNSHENDPETGAALLGIGLPCIIEAIVPMVNLHECYLPETQIYRVYLQSKSHHITEPTEHEGYSRFNISAHNIQYIIKYPEPRFIELTKCNEWDEALI